MDELLKSLLGSQGNLESLARQFNIRPEQAAGALSAVARQLQGSAGEGGLAPALQSLLAGGGLQNVASQAAARSGVDSGIILQILQALLQNRQGGDLLSTVVGLLDRDKDGSVVDDVIDLGRKLL
jgi:hypothetical protein